MEISYITALVFWFMVNTQGLAPCSDVYQIGCYWDKATMDTAASYIVGDDGGLLVVGDADRRAQ